MGELSLVGDHSTVPLTRISCSMVFSKSQNARKAGTLCTIQNCIYDSGKVDCLSMKSSLCLYMVKMVVVGFFLRSFE